MTKKQKYPKGKYPRRGKPPKTGVLIGSCLVAGLAWHLWLYRLSHSAGRVFYALKLVPAAKISGRASYFLGYAPQVRRLVRSNFAGWLWEDNEAMYSWVEDVAEGVEAGGYATLGAVLVTSKDSKAEKYVVTFEPDGPPHVNTLGQPIAEHPDGSWRVVDGPEEFF